MSQFLPQQRPNTDFELATPTSPTSEPARSAEVRHYAKQAMKKVPEITLYFWIIKLLTTAMGETTSDFIVRASPIIAVALTSLGLIIALALQFSVRRYVPAIYWFVVIMIAIFGTIAADIVHVFLGIPYIVSSTFFAVALAAIFAAWYASEKTLSIHSIYTRRRELFYWAVVLATFALGTSLGDMTASTLGLGYLSSGILFALLFAVPALAFWLFGLNEILAFWLAYIITRPLGASFADWLGKPHSVGGVGLGTGVVSLGLTIVIVCLVGYLTITHKDIKSEHA